MGNNRTCILHPIRIYAAFTNRSVVNGSVSRCLNRNNDMLLVVDQGQTRAALACRKGTKGRGYLIDLREQKLNEARD